MDQETLSAAPSEVEAPSSLLRIFNRIFGRHTLNAALLVCLVVAFAGPTDARSALMKDPDMWWHLANARTLLLTHHFIRVEPYAFTVHNERWINPEWLSEVPYWLAYSSFGLLGINLFAVIVFSANLLWVYFRCCSKSHHIGAAFWTAVLGFFLMTVSAGARSILVAYLAMSAEMAILDAAEKGRNRVLWLLPPLFCLWINLHGSWVIGIGLLALYIVCGLIPLKIGVFAQEAFSPTDRNRLIQVFFVSLAFLMVNPYGWRLIWNPFDMLLNQKLMIAITEEWQPLNLATSSGIAAALSIGLMIAASCVRGRKWKLYELAFVFFAWYYAFAHQRFAFMACILTAPLLAEDLARSFFGTPSDKTIPALNAVLVAGAACVLAYLLPSQSVLRKSLVERYPLQSIASIEPSWRTLNDYDLGGIMDFNSKPTFIDSRNDIFEHHGVLQQFLAIEALHDPIKLLDQYQIDHVLIHADSALSFVLQRSPDWRVEMREGTGANAYELFAKADLPLMDKSR
jgi:hypothetical protein